MPKPSAPIRPVGLEAWRKLADLSRAALARRSRLEIDPQTIYNIESGRSKTTTVQVAYSLAAALSEALDEEVTVYDLFPEEGRNLNAPIAGHEPQAA